MTALTITDAIRPMHFQPHRRLSISRLAQLDQEQPGSMPPLKRQLILSLGRLRRRDLTRRQRDHLVEIAEMNWAASQSELGDMFLDGAGRYRRHIPHALDRDRTKLIKWTQEAIEKSRHYSGRAVQFGRYLP